MPAVLPAVVRCSWGPQSSLGAFVGRPHCARRASRRSQRWFRWWTRVRAVADGHRRARRCRGCRTGRWPRAACSAWRSRSCAGRTRTGSRCGCRRCRPAPSPESSAAPSTARRSSATSLRSPRSWARVARGRVDGWRAAAACFAAALAGPSSRPSPCVFVADLPWCRGRSCAALVALLVASAVARRRPVVGAAGSSAAGAHGIRRCRRPAGPASACPLGDDEPVEHEEARARALERGGGLGVAEAVDVGTVLAQVHDERGEVGVGGDEREGVGALGVQDLDGVDGEGDVAGVLALARVELLHRADGVLVQHLLPRLQAGLGPVAVGAAHVGLAEAGQLAEDDVDPGGRRVVGVDEERDLRRFVHARTLCPPARRRRRAGDPRAGSAGAALPPPGPHPAAGERGIPAAVRRVHPLQRRLADGRRRHRAAGVRRSPGRRPRSGSSGCSRSCRSSSWGCTAARCRTTTTGARWRSSPTSSPGLTSIACAVQAWLGNENVWVLYVLVAVWNGAFGVSSPARTSIYPRILPREQLPAANALGVFVDVGGDDGRPAPGRPARRLGRVRRRPTPSTRS